MPISSSSPNKNSTPIWLTSPAMLDDLLENVSENQKNFLNSMGFKGYSGQLCLTHNGQGAIDCVFYGIGENAQPMDTGTLSRTLPEGEYHFANQIGENAQDHYLSALGWHLGGYQFDRYNSSTPPTNRPKLDLNDNIDLERLERETQAIYLARDLINTPANDMGPQQLEDAIRKLADEHKASVSIVLGDDLLEQNFPMIHAVGRASTDAPRLLEMVWGKESDPKLTLVGKGVIFDTGGLNIKPGSSMALMKKDMGGAANVIALAQMIMKARLPVRLRLLVPAVENSISGNAFRPGDILQTRKGITVEIGNTDAEGRLILGDALTLGDEETPQMMIDMATLTGAARVALGPDLPPFYTHDELFAEQLSAAAQIQDDPVWRMPLWPAYKKMLSSNIADINHISTGGFAGSITAALFLDRFVEKAETWAHFDIYGWAPTEKPWVQVGGETYAIRAIYEVVKARFG